MSEDQDRALARRIVDEYGGEYRRWVTDQFRGGGAPVTALLSALMVVVSGAWFVAAENPYAHAELLDRLARTFTLDASDWGAGRWYCHLTHALLWTDNWLNGLVLLAGWVYFGAHAERRLGGAGAVALALGAVFAGGWAVLAVQGPDAAACEYTARARAAALPGAEYLRAALDWVYGTLGGQPVEYLTGPAAAVAAALVVAVLVRDPEAGWRGHPRVVAAAALFLFADLTGVLRFHPSPVAYPGRAAGAAVAVLLLTAWGLVRLATWRRAAPAGGRP